jgi:hypothetical protein
MYGLMALENEVHGGWGLYPQGFSYLSQVDAMVDSWDALWRSLSGP